MQTQTQTAIAPKQDQSVEQKIQKLRELFADAPELGKSAGERAPRAERQRFRQPPTADRKRRPDRRPSRQGLGVDRRSFRS